MKMLLIILLLNLFSLVHLLLIFDITPFKETEINESISRNGVGYFKINLKNVRKEDKNNLYIQYRIAYTDANQYFIVDACGFLEEPTEEAIYYFNESINDLHGIKSSDSFYNYYTYKIPKFENMNWLCIRTTNHYNILKYNLFFKSFYVYSENKEKEEEKTNKNFYFNIAVTIISTVNTLLLALILFKMRTSKNHASIESLDNKLGVLS